jgi:hypothetical protein
MLIKFIKIIKIVNISATLLQPEKMPLAPEWG